jgi:L-lactate dehydrogenase complex protein LldE
MRALLMRTCLSDMVAPSVAGAARTVLERAGVEVVAPRRQTCCGQPAWSSGHPDQARPVARRALRAFAGDDPVVVPSGSCAAMVRHGYPELFAGRPEEDEARRMAERTVELSQFIVREGLDVGAPDGEGRSVTYHDSCHMLRILGERRSARAALEQVEGLELREMEGTEVCCGFGGTFSVNFPEVSGRLGQEKARNAAATGADELVACDLSCLMHIAGRARRTGVPLRVRHLAEVLAG